MNVAYKFVGRTESVSVSSSVMKKTSGWCRHSSVLNKNPLINNNWKAWCVLFYAVMCLWTRRNTFPENLENIQIGNPKQWCRFRIKIQKTRSAFEQDPWGDLDVILEYPCSKTLMNPLQWLADSDFKHHIYRSTSSILSRPPQSNRVILDLFMNTNHSSASFWNNLHACSNKFRSRFLAMRKFNSELPDEQAIRSINW